MQQTIHRDMTIDEIFKKFPQKSPKLAQEMSNQGLQCVGCSASTWETLEAGMYSHGKNDGEIEDLLKRLNRILEEKEDPNTVTLTERAAKKYLEILEEEGKAGWGLRFGERAAGCSGFAYFLDYAEKAQPGDLVLESRGVQIFLNHKSTDRLMGCVIDFVDGLHEAGFKITNPNVKASCGCGNSHGY